MKQTLLDKPVNKYSQLGFAAEKMIHPPGKLLGLLVGMPGSGKSCFIQSNPEAFIINTDASSTTNDEPQACMWPGVDAQGRAIDVGNKPMVLNWQAVLNKKEQLIQMAKDDVPRPETVVVDSLNPAISMVKDHVTEKAGKKTWKEMDGRRAWDDVYEELVRFATDIRKYGYGFYYICHIVNAKIPLGDDRYIIRPELTITDSFYKRLFPLFELVIAFENSWVTESKTVQMKGPGGKPGPQKTVSSKVSKHFVKVNDESLSGITKCRVNLPDSFEVPKQGAWNDFALKYKTAIEGNTK
tara:strand:- start:9886 stop:10776 length:891 start_codon:yes stop_codon:yes gene_type:complete